MRFIILFYGSVNFWSFLWCLHYLWFLKNLLQEKSKKKKRRKKLRLWSRIVKRLRNTLFRTFTTQYANLYTDFHLRYTCYGTSQQLCQTVCLFSVIYKPIKRQSNGSLDFKRIGKKFEIVQQVYWTMSGKVLLSISSQNMLLKYIFSAITFLSYSWVRNQPESRLVPSNTSTWALC